SCDFIPTNEQEFCFSLQALGFNAQVNDDMWINEYFGTFAGYTEIKDALGSSSRCEPKAVRFPFKPTLCRRWWTPEHQRTCGHVTSEALRQAVERGGLGRSVQ